MTALGNGRDASRRAWRDSCVLVVACLLVMPLIVGGVWLYRNDHWPPLADIAATELRVRDVGTVHTPLVGLYGRVGRTPLVPGNHPGPLSFYLLTPVYRMLGGSYWALSMSTIAFHSAAIVLALWIARRRAGPPGVIVAGLLLALLELGYGVLVLTEPWIPHLPVLWFVVFLGAVWSVACGDVWLLPVAAASGSLCAQTHLPYLAVCGGLGVFALVLVAASWARARWRGVGARAHARSVVVAAVVLAVLWAPPALDEMIRKPGNLAIIGDYFLYAPAASVGLPTAVRLTLERFDPAQLALHPFADPGLLGGMWAHGHARRGLVVFALWLAAAVMATRLGNRSLVAFHGVVAASVVVALLAISRIVGTPWNYLMLWAWAIGATMLPAIAATAALCAQRSMSEPFRRLMAPAEALGLVVIGLCGIRLAATVGAVEWGGARAAAVGWGTPRAAVQLGRLSADAAGAIYRGVGASTGDTGRYLVTWDRVTVGLGLMNELERLGLRVGVPRGYGPWTGQHRVLDSEEPTARVHLASAGSLSRWRATPGAVEIAFDDPLTPQDIEESTRLRARVIAALREQGREDVIAAGDQDFDGVSFVGVNRWTLLGIQRMRDIGGPAAVFILPVRGSGVG